MENKLLRVTVEVGGRTYDEDLATQAAISPDVDSLNEALATNPGRFAEWAMLEALARGELDEIVGNVERLDSDIKDLEAVVYLEVIEPPETPPPGWKPPTVDAVKAWVTKDSRRRELVVKRQDLERARIAAKASLDKIGVGRRTIEQKKESLLALASNWRQEMQTKLSINVQQYRPGGR